MTTEPGRGSPPKPPLSLSYSCTIRLDQDYLFHFRIPFLTRTGLLGGGLKNRRKGGPILRRKGEPAGPD